MKNLTILFSYFLYNKSFGIREKFKIVPKRRKNYPKNRLNDDIKITHMFHASISYLTFSR